MLWHTWGWVAGAEVLESMGQPPHNEQLASTPISHANPICGCWLSKGGGGGELEVFNQDAVQPLPLLCLSFSTSLPFPAALCCSSPTLRVFLCCSPLTVARFNQRLCPGSLSNFSPCHCCTMPPYQQLCYGCSTVRALLCQGRLRPCCKN